MNMVGVSLRVVENDTYPETRDTISHDWLRFLSHYQIMPLLIPNVLSDLFQFLEKLEMSAILLSNGNDVGPLFKDEPNRKINNSSAERDATEHKIISFAVKHSIPVFGVCRGMQLLNTYFGGGLVRDLTSICGNQDIHVNSRHEVKIVDSEWQGQLGMENAFTNSYHRQAVTLSTLSDQLLPFALADKEIVEGLYHPDLPIIGIQWHPERDNFEANINRILIKSWLGRG